MEDKLILTGIVSLIVGFILGISAAFLNPIAKRYLEKRWEAKDYKKGLISKFILKIINEQYDIDSLLKHRYYDRVLKKKLSRKLRNELEYYKTRYVNTDNVLKPTNIQLARELKSKITENIRRQYMKTYRNSLP